MLNDVSTVEDISKIYKSDDKMFEFCKEILKKSDLGIEDITIEEKITTDDKKEYLPNFYYKTTKGVMRLSFFDQAAGTKKLYKSLLLYFWMLRDGGTAVIDELENTFDASVGINWDGISNAIDTVALDTRFQ